MFIKRIIVLSIIIKNFLCVLPLLSQALTPAEIYDKVKNSVVMIYISFDRTDTVSQGSGVVANDRGIIITNYHLIAEMVDKQHTIKNVEIINGKDTLENLKVIGSDRNNDLLILKTNDHIFSEITWAQNHQRNIGDVIYTISSPRGYENSISTGIISGLSRTNLDVDSLIQFTATVDKGSSGGALLNSKGELIGIVVSKYTTSDLNFAIPIESIQNIYDQANRFVYQQKLDVLNPDYRNRINLYIEDLSDTMNFYEMGKEAYKRSDFADVIFYYTLYLEENNANETVYQQRGRALFVFNYDSAGVEDYKNLLKLNPMRADILFELGQYYYFDYLNPLFINVDTTYIINAVFYFNKAIIENPDLFAPYVELASIYHNTYKNQDSSIQIMTRAIDRKLNIGYLYWMRSIYYSNLHMKRKQLEDLDNAIKYRNRDSLYNSWPYPWVPFVKNMYFIYYLSTRGKIYYDKMKYEKAIKDFTDIINLNTTPDDLFEEDIYEAIYLRGLSYYELERYEEALTDLEELLTKDYPKDEIAKKIKEIKKLQ